MTEQKVPNICLDADNMRVFFIELLSSTPCFNREDNLGHTLPIAKILGVTNARSWVSMVSYLKK